MMGDQTNSGRKWTLVKPDGGWGWLIVLGTALTNMTTQSLISVFGLLFIRRLPECGIDTSGASLIVSVQITILNLSGLVTGPILKTFSCRQLAFAGGAMVTAGLFLTGYATSLLAFISTYSVFTGLGIGLLFPTRFIAINSYFSTWRARAVGLSDAGTGVGQMLLPFLVRFLLEEYTFQGTVMILSALSAHALVGAALYQPVEWHMKRKEVAVEEEKLQIKEERNGLEDGKDPVVDEGPAKPAGKFSRVIRMMDWNLLRDQLFVILIVELGFVYTANVMFSTLLPFFLESSGYEGESIAICMSVLSGADIVGRLILPSITDIFRLRTKSVLFLGVGLSALARSGLVWYGQSYGQLYPALAIACFVGIVRSAVICNFNLCVADQTSPEKLPSALGLFMVIRGLSVLTLGPLIGYVRDYTESYALTLHVVSAFFLLLPFLLWLIEFISVKRTRR
ncbi:UNVERIFIED_CONTAM: hypothetical protein PYX00_000808 [Menopon gallinae]|uniref:Major facilitator superfamily (MFS) profile domain-containing protein n=1 Tax=Menopon gallinae TaxID=328185 RepID=A0AAW2IBC5_9NEOP